MSLDSGRKGSGTWIRAAVVALECGILFRSHVLDR